MTALDLRSIARALGGEVQNRQVLAPGPGHSRRDRSLSFRLSDDGGFRVHSHAGDDWRTCRDYVAERLGLPADFWRTHAEDTRRSVSTFISHEPGAEPDYAARIARARAIWDDGRDPVGTIVETYLKDRGLDLPERASDVIRFHPQTPWRDDATGEVIRVPAVLAAMREVQGDELTAVHRTRLGPDGTKLGRKMLGIAAGAAIKVDADDMVTLGLHVAEGVETALAGRQLGLGPVWALASAGAMATLPVLPGIETLTLLAENDPASARAVEACASRWHGAGREVIVIEPMTGSDLNDALMSRRAA